jgi:hypothetical protein
MNRPRKLDASARWAGSIPTSLHNAGVHAYNGSTGYRTPLMSTRLLRASLPPILAVTFGLQLAHADIYTWVDASGSINVSNLAPPDGVRVASVKRESAPAIAARAEAAREAARQAEVKALADRVRQLEDIELAKSQAPPPADYRAIPPPPVIQYVVVPPPAPYAVNPAPPANTGCDPAWIGCGLWGIPGIYPTSIVVLRAPNFRHFHRGRGGHQFAGQPPMRPPRTLRRG